MTTADNLRGGPGSAAFRGGELELRGRLTGVAYRMLGSVAEAEDAVQEGYARWYALPASARADVVSEAAWLTTVVSRVCLDLLDSARARHERYAGPWLPEPLPAWAPRWTSLVGDAGSADPFDRIVLEESVSMAMLTLLERLTPAERVAFVLHDVFGCPFAEIAEVTGRSPGACRQLASSARRRVHEGARSRVSAAELFEAVAAFRAAWESGDVGRLVGQLDPRATATIDGGGKVSAALAPLRGSRQVARFFLGVSVRQPGLVIGEETVSGAPGLVARSSAGTVLATASFALRRRAISDIWVVRNPDKLAAWSQRG